MNANERSFPRTTAALGLMLLAAGLFLTGCAGTAAQEQAPFEEDRGLAANGLAGAADAVPVEEARDGELAQRERSLAEREAELAQREQSVARAEDGLDRAARRLEERAVELEQRVATIPAPAHDDSVYDVPGAGREDEPGMAAGDEAAAGPPFPRRSDSTVTDAAFDPVDAGITGDAAPTFVTLPAGSMLDVELETSLSSETSAVGDGVFARAADDVLAEGVVAIPAGTLLTGRVVEAVRQKKVGGQARLTLVFDGLELEGDAGRELLASASLEGKKQSGKDAATIGGAAAGGAILGRVLKDDDRDKGTLVGAVLGAAVGTAIAATNTGDPVLLEPGAVIQLTLDAPLRVAAAGPAANDLLAGR